jgi:hypothetical protein
MAADISQSSAMETLAPRAFPLSRLYVSPPTRPLRRQCNSPNPQPSSCLEGQTRQSDTLRRLPHQPPRPEPSPTPIPTTRSAFFGGSQAKFLSRLIQFRVLLQVLLIPCLEVCSAKHVLPLCRVLTHHSLYGAENKLQDPV